MESITSWTYKNCMKINSMGSIEQFYAHTTIQHLAMWRSETCLNYDLIVGKKNRETS
jgi:hypothetical protein